MKASVGFSIQLYQNLTQDKKTSIESACMFTDQRALFQLDSSKSMTKLGDSIPDTTRESPLQEGPYWITEIGQFIW